MPDNASILPVQSREWSVFGLLQNLAVLGISAVLWVSLAIYLKECKTINTISQHVCGATVGLEIVMIYVRVKLLLQWIKTN
jgi:hypothetical protein